MVRRRNGYIYGQKIRGWNLGFTFFNIFHMGTVYTDRNIKFTFTRHRAVMYSQCTFDYLLQIRNSFYPFFATEITELILFFLYDSRCAL